MSNFFVSPKCTAGYPYSDPFNSHWVSATKYMKDWLEQWGSEYSLEDIGDNIVFEKNGKKTIAKALVIKGCQFKNGKVKDSENILQHARLKALEILNQGQWPYLHFGSSGETGPQLKRYLKDVKQGVLNLVV